MSEKKPFNLQLALAGEAVQTRYGKEVTQLHMFKAVNDHHVYGVCEEQVRSWNQDGRFFSSNTEHTYDLFMAPRKPKEIWRGWVNCYGGRVVEDSYFGYANKELALKSVSSDIPEYLGTFEMIQLDNGELRRVG